MRERKEDIREFVLENAKCLKGKSIGDGFWEELEDYDWPGNIRELISVLKRVGALNKNHELTGEDVKRSIGHYSYRDKVNYNKSREDKISNIWKQIESGKTFWEVVKEPYLKRDLNREQVREVIKMGLNKCEGKYKNLIKLFNLGEKDYHRFMTFLSDNRIPKKS